MGTLIPFGEYRPDCSDLNAAHTNELLNVLPQGDGYGPFPSLSVYLEALPDVCRGYFFAFTQQASVLVFAATATDLYILNNTTLQWSKISKGGTSYSTIAANEIWQFEQYNNYVIAVHSGVNPQYFNVSTSTEFGDLPGNPPRASYIWVTNTFVVLGGLADYPFRVQWSGLGDPTQWTPGVNSSGLQDLADGGTVRGGIGGDFSYIFQDLAIRAMVYAPGSDIIFDISRISKGLGLLAPYSIIADSSNIYFYSNKGFMRMSSGEMAPIGAERVDRTFRENYDATAPNLMQGVSVSDASILMWTCKTNQNSNACFDFVLVYHVVLDRWTLVNFEGQMIASVAQPGITLDALDDVAPSNSIDAMEVSLDVFIDGILPKLSAFDTSNQLCFFNGESLEATLQTSEQSDIAGRMFVQGFYPRTDAATVYGSIARRENLNAAPGYTAEQQMNARGFVPARANTRHARGRIRIPAGTGWTFAQGIDPLLVKRGKR